MVTGTASTILLAAAHTSSGGLKCTFFPVLHGLGRLAKPGAKRQTQETVAGWSDLNRDFAEEPGLIEPYLSAIRVKPELLKDSGLVEDFLFRKHLVPRAQLRRGPSQHDQQIRPRVKRKEPSRQPRRSKVFHRIGIRKALVAVAVEQHEGISPQQRTHSKPVAEIDQEQVLADLKNRQTGGGRIVPGLWPSRQIVEFPEGKKALPLEVRRPTEVASAMESFLCQGQTTEAAREGASAGSVQTGKDDEGAALFRRLFVELAGEDATDEIRDTARDFFRSRGGGERVNDSCPDVQDARCSVRFLNDRKAAAGFKPRTVVKFRGLFRLGLGFDEEAALEQGFADCGFGYRAIALERFLHRKKNREPGTEFVHPGVAHAGRPNGYSRR